MTKHATTRERFSGKFTIRPVLPQDNLPTDSWWLRLQRDSFTAAAAHENGRMRNSLFGVTLAGGTSYLARAGVFQLHE